MEATKENPAPLDAYETAKPDEPIFTLQGGDPLAAPLVRIWAYLARVRAGLSGDVTMIDAPIYIAKITNVEHDPEECKKLLVRASAAEQVSWYMDGYRRGEINEINELQRMDELDRLDVYDIRRRTASLISNFFSALDEYRTKLKEYKFLSEDTDRVIDEAIALLRSIDKEIGIEKKTFNGGRNG